MKTSWRPIRTTLIVGLICGLAFIPLSLGLSVFVNVATAFALILWLYAAVYSVFLCRWGGKRSGSILFPLILLLAAVFFSNSLTAYFAAALLVFSWIRSGICFERSLHGLWAELVIGLGGGALVSFFVNGSGVTWALGIWMFFLIQALYFVFFNVPVASDSKEQNVDPFERSRRMAEEILF